MSYDDTFENAFANRKYTTIAIPDTDVNEVIRQHYQIDVPFAYTRTMLWDMETRKAHQPDKYIRHVVRPGSLETLGYSRRGHLEFYRVTDQKL